MTGFLSPSHILLLLVVVLVLFGAKQLPELGRSLGVGMREFKHSLDLEPGVERSSLAAGPAPDTFPQAGTIKELSTIRPSNTADDASIPPAA